jgi:anti-anti-sigma factor
VSASEGSGTQQARAAGINPGELAVAVDGGPDRYEIFVRGELDMSTAGGLREPLLRLASEEGVHVTVDLSGLAFVDSTGLSVLITGFKRLRQQGGDLVLRAPTPATRRVLEITGLTEVFVIS